MRLIKFNLLLLSFTIVINCSNSSERKIQSSAKKSLKATGYNLSNPDVTIILPDILHEISGITAIDSVTVACIQDEKGIVLIYDLSENEITKRLAFNMDGDYEGIAWVGNRIYILRSDGVLLTLENYGSTVLLKDIAPTGIPAMNNEGLCYDRQNHRLLIAPKENFDKEDVKKNRRPVYGFDMTAGKLIGVPVYNFSLSAVKKFAAASKAIPKEKDKKKKENKEPDIEFKPSDLGIHPLTKELFVLSGAEHLLFVFDSGGTIEYIEKLDRDIFNMPEGITFLNNGDMFISNEGQNGKATLLRFNYKRN
jgi:uncharacterized protein YjiK